VEGIRLIVKVIPIVYTTTNKRLHVKTETGPNHTKRKRVAGGWEARLDVGKRV